MPPIDFTKPVTLSDTLAPLALALSSALVVLRNEARFREDGDETVLNTAQFLCSLVEDAHTEAAALTSELERRVTGADLLPLRER